MVERIIRIDEAADSNSARSTIRQAHGRPFDKLMIDHQNINFGEKMSEQIQPITENESDEVQEQSILKEIQEKAARYRALAAKEIDGYSDEELAEKKELASYFELFEKTETLKQKLNELRLRQLNAVKPEDYSEEDQNLLFGLQLIFREAK